MNITKKNIIDTAIDTLSIEAEAIEALKNNINENFAECIERVYTLTTEKKGRIVVTGVGKSAIIANKITATLNSTGTAALFMHAGDAVHGDLGMIQLNDIVICISKSGESAEVKVLVPLLKHAGNLLIGMTGNMESYLAQNSDYILNTTVIKEACPNNLAPTSSTAAQMAMGDALAICLLKMKNFTSDDFAKYHPGGALGKRLYLKTEDLLPKEKPVVEEEDDLKKVLLVMTVNRLGATVVFNGNELKGMITDGDIRRMLEKNNTIEGLKAKDIMGKNPKTIEKGTLAVEALQLMRQNNITQLIVMDKNTYLGMVHIHDLLKEGLI